ncbi:MAG: ketol-acid reductoisomerase [Maricaulis maris]|jgi:ketol-acid reductoisomerase|uniref:Ketol-acid reductoisomerase (NADP(+)) n=1 Tax=Maricaulis maris (strain MCS10) TaxID=394221 RepID=Q0AT04_MARMM|nr:MULTISPECIES: ketol-acid reductoisomerase [Maricaulis]ABI64583.1 ketol-acid reductoisomerase [Maricaulis maris MCS10]MAC89088.1 ketol-acid reductoisomerase [Maricaulis sp.]
MTAPTPSRRADFEVDTTAFKAQPIAVIGYGSQGRAHAMNLKESGCDVTVGVRPGGPGEKKAKADGLKTATPEEATKGAKLIAILTPDMSHEALFRESIAPNLSAGDAVLFAHGFSVHFGRVTPPEGVDVILVAPKGPGDLVRREYEIGRGVPCLFAVQQDATGEARNRALGYTAGIGGANSGIIETTFAEETETDLFGEQAVLCGGATELVMAGYETLVDAGYQPEVAYFECLHELKLIVDLLYEGGMAKMHEFISETAIYGDLRSGPRVINDETRARMREVLKDIQDGTFARDWITENQAGKPQYQALLRKDLEHPIEKTGAALRADMPWLQPGANA